jgi:paraquat-inducible protein B
MMTDKQETQVFHEDGAMQASVAEKRGFSMVWLVPIIAAVIAVWLVYKAATEKGPTITIEFETGQSITAGKTKVRYRNVDVGVVQEVQLKDDLKGVILSVEMKPGTKHYLSPISRFWVVRARVAAGEVTGLGTLLSGAYIAFDPQPLKKWQRATKSFVGLEKAPAISSGEAGKKFTLRSDALGSLQAGSPVYYHQIEVGRVTDHKLLENGQIMMEIFVFSPNDDRVTGSTRFWNAGGVDITLDAGGLKIDTESLVSIMLGGIAFDTPKSLEDDAPIGEGHEFTLYQNRAATLTKTYQHRQAYLTYFDGSLRGLAPGSPVEFRGMRVGKVLDVRLEVVPGDVFGMRAPVLIEFEPERISGIQIADDEEASYREMLRLGFRTQLKTGSLITGQKVVNVDFFEDAPAVSPARDERDRYWIVPSIPAKGEEIINDLAQVANNLSQVPFDKIGNDLSIAADGMGEILGSDDLRKAVEALSATLQETEVLVKGINADIAPALASTLEQTEKTATSVRTMLDANTGTQREITRLVIEMTEATRSLQALTEYIEQHPESFIRGKRK